MKIESEKLLERKLKKEVEGLKGLAIKLAASHFMGLPDRLCLLPKGHLFFVEVKTTGKGPTKLQLIVHKKLRKLGFSVYIIDTSEQIKDIIKHYA